MKIFRSGFWTKAFICLIVLFELGLLIYFIYVLSAGFLQSTFALLFLLILFLLNLLTVVVLFNTHSQVDYKLSWLSFICILPVFGLVFYVLFAHKFQTTRQKEFLNRYNMTLKETSKNPLIYSSLERDFPASAKIAHYIENASLSPVYQNSSLEYFSLGDEAFPIMIEELKKAKHYIFLEYFIIHPGLFWDSIEKILIEKAKEGLDIRLLYDDFGSMSTLPIDFASRLKKAGIQCNAFSKIRPFLDIRMNNRDHRKILVIDGHTAFSGGINLADEYINKKSRFGHWKDNAVMVKGKAVEGFTFLFLSNWKASFGVKDAPLFYDYYRPETFIDEIGGFPKSDGYLQPYGDLPYDKYSVGVGVYSSMIMRARKYLYISTPYLILDTQLKAELVQAALSGVDVRLLIPGIPDKKLVYSLTEFNCGELLKAGVRIYKYTPGFVHQKMFISDDEVATCGTINLDYRALYLHMENGLFVVNNSKISSMRDDFLSTLEVSKEMSLEDWKKRRKRCLLKWIFLNFFSPLL